MIESSVTFGLSMIPNNIQKKILLISSIKEIIDRRQNSLGVIANSCNFTNSRSIPLTIAPFVALFSNSFHFLNDFIDVLVE